jgi:hypothetical protein
VLYFKLQRVVRKSVTEFTTTDINAVSFSRLVPVNPQNPVVNKPVEISTPFPSSLLDICRLKIRQTVREATSEVCELNFCSYFNEKKRMERKRRNTTTSTASDSVI